VGLPAALFAGSYLAALTLEAIFAPFRLTPIAGIYGGPLLRIKATLAAFDWRATWDIPAGDILLFLPAGFLAVTALVELGWQRPNPLRLTIVGGTLLWAGAELFHGFLALPIGLGALLTHALSMAAGALLADRFLPAITRSLRGRTRPRYLFWCYAALLLLWTWRPYLLALAPDIASQFSLGRLIPLQGSAPKLDLYSVADIVESFLLYLPLGALLAVWPFRQRGALSGYLPGIYLAALGELGQPFIAARYFDVTDILVGAAGLGIGWAVVRRAGFSPYGEMLPATETSR
jgi:glycopeptide antibiotics resistance protein